MLTEEGVGRKVHKRGLSRLLLTSDWLTDGLRLSSDWLSWLTEWLLDSDWLLLKLLRSGGRLVKERLLDLQVKSPCLKQIVV